MGQLGLLVGIRGVQFLELADLCLEHGCFDLGLLQGVVLHGWCRSRRRGGACHGPLGLFELLGLLVGFRGVQFL